MNDLEQRLHDVLAAEARDVVVPGDAFQRNRQRLVNDRARQRTRRFRLAGVAAAVVALLAFVAPSVPQVRRTFDSGASQGPGQVGRKVQIGTVTESGTTVPWEASLTTVPGDGVEFCDGYYIDPTTFGSCVQRDGLDSIPPDPRMKPGVLPYFTEYGNDDGSQRALAGAVTARVARVQVVRADGTRRSLPLHELDFDGLQAFGFFRAKGQPTALRLMVFDKRGDVLHTVDLSAS